MPGFFLPRMCFRRVRWSAHTVNAGIAHASLAVDALAVSSALAPSRDAIFSAHLLSCFFLPISRWRFSKA